jgi:phenylacetate-CoA ligase
VHSRINQSQSVRALKALNAYFELDLDRYLNEPAAVYEPEAERRLLQLFHDSVTRVPAYRAFLARQGIDLAAVQSLASYCELPATTKQNYHKEFSLAELCLDGSLGTQDMLAVSSGSTGEPTVWPRFMSDELLTAARFEQVLLDGFDAKNRRTLGVVCFALGTWVGGMYTTACLRHVAAKGYPLTVVTPGNQPQEIMRVLRALSKDFEQVVLFGYPPFLKDVIDIGAHAGYDWAAQRFGLVTAGEVFSEEWRTLVCERLGAPDPDLAVASLYGTADGGVLANETPYSVRIRRALANRPDAARELFGEARLPTLCQFDPRHRYFEAVAGDLIFSGESGAPLCRYRILDRGGVIGFDAMQAFVAKHGLELQGKPGPVRPLPFVYVFGRSSFAVSFYGANVYPENISIGIEQPEIAGFVTGKFVLEVARDAELNPRLRVTIELAAASDERVAALAAVGGESELGARAARSIVIHLERVNSEFRAYVPRERKAVEVVLLGRGDPGYFPAGVKHRYTRESA